MAKRTSKVRKVSGLTIVNGDQKFNVTHPLRPTDSVILVQSLSGG